VLTEVQMRRAQALFFPDRFLSTAPNYRPTFSYPGAKNNLAILITGMFAPGCTRFVDCFAGRGSVSYASMVRCNFSRHWINDIARAPFFKLLRTAWLQMPPIRALPPRGGTLRALKKSPAWRKYCRTLDPLDLPEGYGRSQAQFLGQGLAAALEASSPQPDEMDSSMEGGLVPRGDPRSIWAGDEAGRERFMKDARGQLNRLLADSDYSTIVEPFFSYSGGIYRKNGPKGIKETSGGGGITPEGFTKNVLAIGSLFRKHKPRITQWPWQRVLAECGRESMVYL